MLRLCDKHRCLLFACLAVLLAGCGKEAEEQKKSHARTVTAATVKAMDVPLFYDTLGRATAFESVHIVSQVNGQIMEVHFTQGSMVKEGDPLFTIYQPPFEAAVTEARGELVQSIAALEIAKLEVERSRPLVPEDLISEQDFQQLEANVVELEGRVEENTGALERAQINLDFCSITAPVDGMIGIYQINVGNVVTAAALETLTTIEQMQPIYIDFIVPTTEFPQVLKYYTEFDGKLTAEIRYLNNTGPVETAAVTIVGNQVAENTGTINLRATTPNKDLAIWPNQPLSVRIILDTLKGALVVPNGAVAIGQQGHYVFVIKDDKTVEQRIVSIGQRQDDGMVVVEKGVKEGERVVVDGQVFLMPGEEVIVTNVGSPKNIRLPKTMTTKVIDMLKKHDRGSPQLFEQIEKTGQLPVDVLEKLKSHGVLSPKETSFIEMLEGYGDAGQGLDPKKESAE